VNGIAPFVPKVDQINQYNFDKDGENSHPEHCRQEYPEGIAPVKCKN
jgi:hypothetical protein